MRHGDADLPTLVVLISGNGSNLQAIIDAIAHGSLAARIAAVISNEPDAGGLERARRAGIPTRVVCHRDHAGRSEFDRALAVEIEGFAPDLLVLAGFMRILGADFVRRYPGRILNIHPALLPRFRGTDTHRRALEAGVAEHGASVHVVTEELDAGPVIRQARVPVLPDDDPDTLAARVLAEEHRLYPAAIAEYLSRLSVAPTASQQD